MHSGSGFLPNVASLGALYVNSQEHLKTDTKQTGTYTIERHDTVSFRNGL